MNNERMTRQTLGRLTSVNAGPEREASPIPSPEYESNGIKLVLDKNHRLDDGKGLLSLVFKGDQNGHEVAIKLFSPQSDFEKDVTEKDIIGDKVNFDAEITLLESADHPNIPHFISRVSFATPDGKLEGFARELFVDSVDKLIKPKETNEILAMAEQISSALEYLAARGEKVFVTDLCPYNIMVRGDGTFAISDLNLTASATVKIAKFTDGYVAPEVANLSSIGQDETAEVYSLAAVVYRLLGGEVIESPETNLYGFDIEPSENISPAVLEVLKKATEFEAKNRYQTPTEFAKALSAAASLDVPIV